MTEDTRPIVEVRDVIKYYDPHRPVLQSCCLDVMAGESVAIVGPSGSGKSTLLNLIAAIDTPVSGSVLVDGTDLATLDHNQLATMRNRKIGFVFQQHHLLDQCTTGENILLPALPYGGVQDCAIRAKQLLEKADMLDRINDFPSRLSGGQQQRVAVIRALINNPAVLLADEPTGSLDRDTAEKVVDMMIELQQSEKISMIMVTHSEQIASRMSRVLYLLDGKLVEHGNGETS